MIKPPERVEIPQREEAAESFARLLAVAIVISTLLLALVEFAHGLDAKAADAAGVEGQKLGVQRQGEAERAEQMARTQLALFGLAEEQRTRGGNAAQATVNDAVSGHDGAANLNEVQRWADLAKLTDHFTPISEGGPVGPDRDPSFPNLAIQSSALESEKAFALQDAANAEREAWESRLSQYAFLLTLLAVAIYLFGLSLTLQRAMRRLISSLAVLLVVVSVGWGGSLQIARPAKPSEEAATAYAQGRIAAMTALTLEDIKKADELFTKAIDARPTFAQAYVERASVRFIMGSPEFGSAVASITTSDALRTSTADLQKAYELHLRTFLLLNNLAANDILLGLSEGRADLYRQAISLSDEGVAIDSASPLLYSNKALANLLLGDGAGADRAFGDFIDKTLYIGGDHHARNDAVFTEQQLAGALTPLQLVADRRPDLADQANADKERLVLAFGGGGTGATRTVKNVKVEVFPSTLQWTGQLPDITDKDAVSVQWYHNDPGKLGWTAISGISGLSTPKPDNSASAANSYFDLKSFLLNTGVCTSPGQYRVEIYINGHLASPPVAGDAADTALRPALMRSIGAAMCEPKDWQHDQADYIRGFADVYTSPDSAHGVVVERVQNPSKTVGTDSAGQAKGYRDLLITFADVVPKGLSVDKTKTPESQYFLGLKSATVVYETDGKGHEAIIGCGYNPADGSIVIGIVYGPLDDFGSSQTAEHLFDSLILE